MNDLVDSLYSRHDGNYLTHNLHPYPAKFPPIIPKYFIEKYAAKSDSILDPFCGSGTTLVESKLHGYNAIGIDIHPIAVLVSNAKTTTLKQNSIKKILHIIEDVEDKINRKKHNPYEIPEFFNRDHWFDNCIQKELSLIVGEINNIKNRSIANLLKTTLSAIMIRVSNQASDTRYVAVKKNTYEKMVFSLFQSKTKDALSRVKAFTNMVTNTSKTTMLNQDSRNLKCLKKDSIDLVITSPPYPNVYDYYLYHKQRLHWYGYDVDHVKNNEIGSRLRYSSLKWNIDTFYTDMQQCFNELHRVVKPKKHVVIVMGDSIVQKEMIDGFDIINKVGKNTGFKIVEHVNYPLDIVSRSFSKSFRQKNKQEHIILLRNT